MEPKMLLRNPEIFPTEDVLKKVLGDLVYNSLSLLIETVTSEEFCLTIEWRFYNDGKAWFGKVVHKKKTILWLSIWEGFYRVGFYFAEKYRESIAELSISDTIKQKFKKENLVGRLIPIILDVKDENQIKDIPTIITFKKNIK